MSEIEGSELLQIALTERAAERIGLEMGDVERGAGTRTVIPTPPWSTPRGETWVYTSPKPLTFVRHRIVVESSTDTALLTAGPAVGTAVVTVGAAELFGTEQGIGQ